jgi:hypothetical protein
MKRLSMMFCAAIAALTLAGTALAQSAIPPDQLANFNQFLSGHPEVGEFLLSNHAPNQYQNFTQTNPGFQQFLNNSPNLRDYMSSHPQWFQQQQRNFYQSRGFTPGQVSALNGFLGKHPGIARDFDQNSNLAFNQGYQNAHPDLKRFLSTHPGIAGGLKQNPWMLSRNRRFAQPNWWGPQRAYNQGYAAGGRNAPGQAAEEEEEEEGAERGDSPEQEDSHGHHDHGRHLGWYKHRHHHHDDGDDDDRDEDHDYAGRANWNRGDHDFSHAHHDRDHDHDHGHDHGHDHD